MLRLKSILVLLICMVLIVFFSVSCDKDKSPTTPPEPLDIVGTWEVSQIGSVTDADGSNSTWTFKADGTYEWFLLLLYYDYNGEGTYTLDGSYLTVDGIVAELYYQESKTLKLTISNNNNTFSILDPDGDTCIYNRKQ